jgi:ferredoxin-NADP reductase
MAGTALRRGLGTPWRPAELVEAWPETASARTLRFAVPDWPGHLPGQHVDVRLTADDGYTAQRSYSASAPANGQLVEISVQQVEDGEVSPYLVQDMQAGDTIEVRGPLGGWFVWGAEQTEPVLLVGGGSGIAAPIAMLRARARARVAAPFKLIYSVRAPDDVYFRTELFGAAAPGVEVAVLYTRTAPSNSERAPHRIDPADLAAHGWAPGARPTCYVCGPTPFVETVANLLTEAGHDPARIRTERFGDFPREGR